MLAFSDGTVTSCSARQSALSTMPGTKVNDR